MKRKNSCSSQMINVVFALFLMICTESIRAKTHVINFGGTLGLTYSPSSFSASIGDTVQWVGDFSAHPLSSTTIPANAPTWHMATGNTFNYRITVAGDYHYKCDTHVGAGMIGSFSASVARVLNDPSLRQTGDGNRTPCIFKDASGQPYAQFALANSGAVTLKIYDLLGRERAILINGIMQAGSVTVRLAQETLNPGPYFLRFTGNSKESSQIFILH